MVTKQNTANHSSSPTLGDDGVYGMDHFLHGSQPWRCQLQEIGTVLEISFWALSLLIRKEMGLGRLLSAHL